MKRHEYRHRCFRTDPTAAAGATAAGARAGLAEDAARAGRRRGRRADAPDPAKDQHRIGQRAGRTDGEDMLAPDALAQHEGILCPDGEDQAEAGRKALEKDGERAQSCAATSSGMSKFAVTV